MNIITKKGDFEDLEREKSVRRFPNATSPNMLTLGRAIGGPILGGYMMVGAIEPKDALIATAALVASDAEGTLINAGKKLPTRISDFLRIWPSKGGKIGDPVADKALGIPFVAGGLIGGLLPAVTSGILVTELATVGAAIYAKNKTGVKPQVSTVGKVGIIARFGVYLDYLTAQAVSNETAKDTLMNTGHVLTSAAIALGTLSCVNIIHQARQTEQPSAG